MAWFMSYNDFWSTKNPLGGFGGGAMMYLAFLLKPFIALALFALLVYPIAWAIDKVIPNGKVKRFLYKRRYF
jgi:hypothetical protein